MHKRSAYILVIAVATLVAIGIVMLFSTGAYAPDSHGDQFSFLKKQSISLGCGGCALVVCALVDYHWWRRSWTIWYAISVVLLGLCFVHGVGSRLNGSYRWVHFGSIAFQPSDLAKFAAVTFVAWWCAKFESDSKKVLKGVIIPLAVVLTILGLIAAETDLGTTILIGSTSLLMLFVAGANLKALAGSLLLGFGGLAFIATHINERRGRLMAFLHPEEYQKTEGHQQYMSLIAFGSGGIDGLGLGNGRQKMLYLPYAHTDFIFPVIGEELGLRVTLLIVFCFLLLMTGGTLIALNAKDRFGTLLGFGLTSVLGIQAMINIGVTTSLLPNKGLPLPFISYGGSNLVFCLICVGILINIYRNGKDERVAEQTQMQVRIRHLSKF